MAEWSNAHNLAYFFIGFAHLTDGVLSDTEKANSLWVDAQRILHDDAISIFAIDAPNMFAHGDDIQGFVPVPPYATVVFWYNMSRSK